MQKSGGAAIPMELNFNELQFHIGSRKTVERMPELPAGRPFEEERIAFFAMRVYCSLYRKQYRLLEDAPQPEKERFFDCARKYQGDNAFVKSVLCYTGADLPLDSCPAPKKLKAYDMVAEFFKG